MHQRIIYTPREEKKVIKTQKRKLRIWFIIFLTAITLTFAVSALLFFPYGRVSKININGVDVIFQEVLRKEVYSSLMGNYAWIVPKSMLLALDTNSVSLNLQQKFPQLEKVIVSKKYPNGLEIFVAERKFLGIFCNDFVSVQNPRCAFIDDSGFAYEEASNSYGALITKIKSDMETFQVPSQVVAFGTMARFKNFAEEFKKEIGEEIIGYEILSKISDETRLVTANGYKIYVKLDADAKNTAHALKRVLEEEIAGKKEKLEYIDMRFGNKMFYKMRN